MTDTTKTAGELGLDELWHAIQQTIAARYAAGKRSGEYHVTPAPTAADATRMLEATANADELEAVMWDKLYTIAPALKDALDVLDAVKGLEVQA